MITYYLSSQNRNSPDFVDGLHDFFGFKQPRSLLSALADGVADYSSRYELKETESGDFEFSIALPGYKKDEVSITVENRTLTITAKNTRGEFSRSVDLFETIDGEKIEATLENGLLVIVLKRTELSKPRKIALK